jgi:hypothetical protein
MPRRGSRPVASSFHLWWQFDDRPAPTFVEVSAVCEVVVAPVVSSLYFWALQVGFHDGRTDRGAAHTGLQWHGRRRGERAVNWGGYRAGADGGGELAGSVSPLRRLDQNGNTVAYSWEPGRPYRLGVGRGDEGWEATVTDQATGNATVIRELYAPGDRLISPVVWSEVFAGCEEPSVTVRWSDLWARTSEGVVMRPSAVAVTYQDAAADGCENTDVAVDSAGILQVTNSVRQTEAGAVLPVPGTGGA